MYSVDEAIFLQHIYHWYLYNKSNNKNFYDSRYWTYNSISAFAEQFIYLSEKQIRNILLKLENKSLIVTGNYNKISYDRTKWYSITEKGLEILENLGIHKEQEIKSKATTKKENTILPNENIHFTKQSNGTTEKGEPIPYLNTDLKQIETNKEIKNSCKIEISQEKELQINQNNQLSIINNSIIAKQNDLVNQFPEIIDLYDLSLIETFNDNKYTIKEFILSDEFQLIKKEYRMLKKDLPAPKPRNKENLIKWYLEMGKVQVAENLYMYPYQAILLKLIYNHKYLAKKISEYDAYFGRDVKFKEFTDHYTNIKKWLDFEVEKAVNKVGISQTERYYYLNWGVGNELN
jgi:DNA-binding PadR family transcriptional regulator